MKRTAALGYVAVFFAIILCGCRVIRIEEEPREPLEFAIVRGEEIPKEVLELIEEKKKEEFQLTYQEDKNLYIIKGYGQQMTGGCSIRVEEVSRSSNGLFFKTRLVGPEDGKGGGEPSYPYIVVKIGYRKEPVEFV